MEEKVEKKNFFKKIWYSITKFEQYPEMAAEGLKRALKYLIGITAIVSVFAMIGSVLETKNMVKEFSEYVDANIPEFSYSNGNLSMEIEQPIIREDVEDIGFDRIVIDPIAETDEQKKLTETVNTIEGMTLFFLKDEMLLKANIENEEVSQTLTYSDFIANYTGENAEEFNKTEFVQYLTSDNMSNFYSKYALSIFVSLFIANIMLILIDVLEIALLGWITTIVARIRMRFVAIYNMAVYSITLSVFLNIMYIIINYFTDFSIKYFQIAYIAVAYIYLAAAIFILKDDVIKKMQEVEKIKQEQLKVREEIQEKEKTEVDNDDKKEDKEDDKKGEEPQGSET